MIDVKAFIYLSLIVIIIFLFYSCYNNRTKNNHESFQYNKIYEIPNQLTSKTAKALVLSCIDFRLIDDEVYYFNKMGYANNYDKFILAGASLGYNQTKYPEWGQTLNTHIEVAIKLHKIDEIIVLEHMGCGAYKIFYNKDTLTKTEELDLHKLNATKFKKYINVKFPTLKVRSMVMDLDGSVIQI